MLWPNPTEAIPLNDELQKANLLKRISAGTFDMILLVCLIVLLALTLSAVLGYDGYADEYMGFYDKYGEQFDIDLNKPREEYDAAQQEKYDAAIEAMGKDEDLMRVYSLLMNLTLVIASVSVLLGHLLLELLVPLLFGNGQTLGKKAFGIALVRVDGVKVTPFMMVVRTVLGKYTVETMIPVLIVIMILFGFAGLTGTLIIGLILLTQVILLVATRTHALLHDMMACTVAVDMASQRIFDSPQARLDYLKQVSAQEAARKEY